MRGRKKMTLKEAARKYANGTTYKTPDGKTKKRTSAKGTKKADAYCARSSKQKQTMKVKARRKAWGCSGTKSKRKKKK